MAAADDDLAALDALDAAISDPQRDDDDALDAYEELIALAARDAAPAPALSKTAQLLTKHFARFPHVHANVLDALLALCVRARPQAVRIHTLRALIQLARTLSPDARERVHAAVAALAATETSGVITRTMNELGKVLRDRSKADKPPMDKAKDPEQRGKKDQKARAESVDGSGTNAPAAAATGERDKTTSRDPDLRATLNESREERRQRDEEAAGARKKQRLEELLARPPDSPVRVPNGPGAYACPPSPYIHLSNVPHGARPADVAAFLSTVDAGIKAYCVHIKFAPGASTGYAFASLATTPLAVEAIRFAKAEKFRGAFLVANFARGPACNTITFAWRNDRGWALAPDGSLRTFDFSRCKSAVWSRLCDTLRRFGEMDVLEQGKVRFHNIEHAKEVIKTNHFTVQSFDLAPVYSLAEQQENDATRPRHDAQAVRQGFALKSGRVVGDREPDDRRGQRQSTERSATGSRRQDENEREHGDRTRAKESSARGDDSRGRKRTPSPERRYTNSDRRRGRSESTARYASPSARKPTQEALGRRSKSRSPAPSPRTQQPRGRSSSSSAGPARARDVNKQHRDTRERSYSPSKSPARKQSSRSSRPEEPRAVSPAVASVGLRTLASPRRRSRSPRSQQTKTYRERVDSAASAPWPRERNASAERRRRSNSPRSREWKPPRDSHRSLPSPPPPSSNQRDIRGSEHALHRRQSRSRSGERERFVARDMSSYGPSRRVDSGRSGSGRDQVPREADIRSFDRPQVLERRDSGFPLSNDMSRYGPTFPEPPRDRRSFSRDEQMSDRQTPRRDVRDSPQRQPPPHQLPAPSMSRDSPRMEQRGRSRSVPRLGDMRGLSRSPQRRSRSPLRGERGRSRSPQQRGPPKESGPPQRESGDNGGHGREPPFRLLEQRTSSSSRRNDERSIAEVAREEHEERQRQLRRASFPPPPPPPGHLPMSRSIDSGRDRPTAHFHPPPPLPAPLSPGREARARGGSFHKPRSRSRSPPGRQGPLPPAVPPHARGFGRGGGAHSAVPPHVRDLNRGGAHSPLPPHMRDLIRGGHSPVPPHVRDLARDASVNRSPLPFEPKHGDTDSSSREPPRFEPRRRSNTLAAARDSPPSAFQSRERRESDAGRSDRRGRSPPASPRMGGNDRHRPASPLGDRRHDRSRSPHGQIDSRLRERDRDNGRYNGPDSGRDTGRNDYKERGDHQHHQQQQQQRQLPPSFSSSDDQNNRNRANRQASSSASRREVFSPAFGSASSPAGKREVRAFPPSPARRGDATNKRSTRERSRSRSPLGRRAPWSTGDADANRSSEKKRRVVVVDDDDDDVLVLPKPSAAAAFDDMDEMMVDYEED